jgi:hypothetical protein
VTDRPQVNCPVCGCSLGVDRRTHRERWNVPQIELVLRLHRLTVGQKTIGRIMGADIWAVRHLLARLRHKGAI